MCAGARRVSVFIHRAGVFMCPSAHGGQGKPCGVHGGYDGLILLCFATRRDVYQPACISTGTQALVCVLPLLSLFLLLRLERQTHAGAVRSTC